MGEKISKKIFNPVAENVKRLAELFPSVVKDGEIDFEALKLELGEFQEVGKEKYELTWPGKTQANQLANTDIVGRTLRYVPEDSKNSETTENLYIEGDNLDVLKLLRNSYYGKIKMIYIDPPYNTGNDFIYNDDFAKQKLQNDIDEGNRDKLGNSLVRNQNGNSRFHSSWLNMMYTRLKISKDLLKDDGVIFISIDDNEASNLKNICDEILGEDNFVGTIIWEKIHTRKNSAKYFSVSHDYIICYAKIKISDNQVIGWKRNLLRREDTSAYGNPDNDPRGPWKPDPIYANNPYEANYVIEKPNGAIVKRPQGKYWRYSEETINNAINEKRIIWNEGNSYPTIKRYLSDVQDGLVPTTLFYREFAGDNSYGNNELKNLFGVDKIFPYPKPSKLIKRLLEISVNNKDIILDFFSGSSSTAHAVMEYKIDRLIDLSFIMVQIPEECDKKSEAYKAGYKNICEIGKERIRRAGEKIKEEFKDKEEIENLDVGFKVFRVADTNIRWGTESFNCSKTELEKSTMAVKDALDFNPNFTDIDVVYEIMLRHRDFPLTSKIEKLSNIGERTYIFADAVVVCLEENITNKIIDGIAAIEPKPIKVIFRDSAFDDDISLKLNTMNRLDAQLKKYNEGKDKSYRVEFI